MSGVYYFQTATTPTPATGYAIGLAVTVLWHVGYTALITTQKSEELAKKIDQTSEEFKEAQIAALDQRFKIDTISPREAETRLSAVASTALVIKNTYVKLSDSYGAQTEIGRAAIAEYCKFLSVSSEKSWIDITTYGDLNDGRYSEICAAENIVGRHTIHITDGTGEIINFLLAEGIEGPTDVMFGWISNSHDGLEIFHSQDHRLITLFENYFNLLRLRAIDTFDIDYTGSKPAVPSKANSLLGRWLTVSLVKSSDVESGTDFDRYSVMDVKIVNGTWNCSVQIIERKPGFLKVGTISTEHVQAFDSSIYYNFQRRTMLKHIEEEGFGNYTLSDVSPDIIAGSYIIPNKNKMVQTFAMRVSDIDFNAIVEDDSVALKYLDALVETNELELKSSVRKRNRRDSELAAQSAFSRQ